MEILTEKIDLNNLDKSNWETFKFDEIAQKISKTIDPNETILETYVGLEHIDAEDLHIRRKGTPDDVKGGKLRCYPGDIIFGKRRAYQRKAAIVDFDGICSAHAFVLRANSEVIDPKLFPFFLHSDQFMHRMVDISVGGLSPTINWGDLKHQEFLLPPKDQQAQLAKLLWAMDEVIEKEKEVYNSLSLNKMCFINELKKNSTDLITLRELFDINWGDTNTTKKSYVNSGYTAFSASGPDGYLNKYDFDTYGIVLSAIGAECGKCFLAEGKWSAIKNTITLIPKEIDEAYVKIIFEIINNKSYWPSNGGAQPFISQATARKSKIPFLTPNNISEKYKILCAFNIGLNDSKLNISAKKSLQKSLINQIF